LLRLDAGLLVGEADNRVAIVLAGGPRMALELV
jgi:hypothetical protein